MVFRISPEEDLIVAEDVESADVASFTFPGGFRKRRDQTPIARVKLDVAIGLAKTFFR